MPSKVVYLRRRKNNTKLPDDLYWEANRKVGSSFASGTRDVLRGLTPDEELKYLPEILGVGPNEPTFRQAKKDFWCDISIVVEAGEGTAMEVGLDASGEPINLNDWINYKFALKHSDVAPNEEAVNETMCRYFIHDPQARQLVDQADMRKRKVANKLFITISDDDVKMRQVLRLLGYDTRLLEAGAEAAELQLEKFVKATPEKFVEVASDDSLETKAFIEECISAKVIEKMGNVYFDGDQTLGNTLKEAVFFLSDPVNSKTLTVLKARLESSTI